MTKVPAHAVVWSEIPVTDMDRAMTFYNEVLQTRMVLDQSGPNPLAKFPADPPELGVAGHIYPGKPAGDGTGPTIHLAVPGKVEEAMDRVRNAGGTVLTDPIQIPPGRFAYCLDLDGNSIGLFEAT